jgi:glyoxylase-like metal-dependent hydrolase (beta-lactamase superfamily II)
MRLQRFEHPVWLSNTWLLDEGDGGDAVIVDAGGPVDDLLAEVRTRRLRVTRVLATHHHADHIAAVDRLRRATGAPLCAHRLEAPLVPGCDETLEDGQVLRAGGLAIRVLHIPGHTAGQAAYLANEEVVFTGDTLFRGSVGGTTAPGHTTFADLRRSLIDRLMRLAPATRVAPGHAAPTTIGEERERNPFIRVLEGRDAEGDAPGRHAGLPVRIVVWARDYDGGFKAWIRRPDGTDATVPGSRVERP